MERSFKDSLTKVRDCFVVLMVASGLLAMTTGVWGCDSGGDGGNGDVINGVNSSNNTTAQAACDNYCQLCDKAVREDCMEQCPMDVTDVSQPCQEFFECYYDEGHSLEDCMEDCLPQISAASQVCQECMINMNGCGPEDSKCHDLCDDND